MNYSGNTKPGYCAMRGSCGSKGWSVKQLPCPYNGPAIQPDNDRHRRLLTDVCGESFSQGPSCCTADQLETLRDNLNQAENIIYSCPACRNNFRNFFCTFTCSPDQATFINITSTQKSSTDQVAVESLDFAVAESFAQGFFDSCKEVKVGATNGYAMDLIGGGAKDYPAFLKFLGDKKDPLGSPFQINFPPASPAGISPLNIVPRNCSDNDLGSRCTCVDCSDVCLALPPVSAPGTEPTCTVGLLSCLSFVLILAYALSIFGFLSGYFVQRTIRKRREKSYERVALSIDTASLLSPGTRSRGLVGAASLAHAEDDDGSIGTQSSRNLGQGATLIDPVEAAQPRQYKLNVLLRNGFYKLGLFAATTPWLTMAAVFLVVGLLNIGWKKFSVETDPVRLWVSPTSESKLQKEFFDENFGPFYRPQQLFVTSYTSDSSTLKSPVLSWDHIKYLDTVQKDIRALRSTPNGYTLNDVCFKPAGPRGACVVQSVTAWFGDDIDDYDEDTWEDHLLHCAHSPVDCLPDFQQPLTPNFVLGGIHITDGKPEYLLSEAMVVNFVVSDSLDEEVKARAMEWETTLRTYLVNLVSKAPTEAGLSIAFSTGISLEEEINKSTNTDVKIVVLSYLAMFFYISLTLGRNTSTHEGESLGSSLTQWFRNLPQLFKRKQLAPSIMSIDSSRKPRFFPRLPWDLFINSKFTLGLLGISLVVLSVSTSVGFFSLCGVKVTLIIAEVIPFLVLAVGVDNVFILVHELDRQNLLHGPNAALAPVSATHGPSYHPTMSPTSSSHRTPFTSSHEDDVDTASVPQYLSCEERVARALAKMGPSILLSTVTETVAFGLGALVPMPAVRNFALYAAGSVFLNAFMQVTVFVSAMTLDLRRVETSRVDCFPCIQLTSGIALLDGPPATLGLGFIAKFIRRRYAPFILRPWAKAVIVFTFAGAFVLSVISMQHIQLGLDQRLALPSDSYLVPYFDNLDKYLEIGPPVYFVSHNVNVTQRDGQRALCARFPTCDDFSVANVLEAERKRPESSFISEPSAAWIDDFLNWIDPAHDTCCRVRKADKSHFCTPRDRESLCQPCFQDHKPAWNMTMDGFPEGEEFMYYLKQWLISPTTEECPLAGKASFGAALSISADGANVAASHFRTFHKPLKSQEDFINSFAAAHRIASEISESTGTDVFPYSLHYVFFDQYAHIIAITQEILGLGLASVLVVTALMLGSWRTGTIVTAVVALTVINVMGVMAIWGISLNAISLVNLVISLGIAVEFCAHMARAFMSAPTSSSMATPTASQKERDERVWTALVDVGPSVLSGITFTKLIGMSVLALTRSKLLEVYYFRMWLTLIISGAFHGLVLLPVILSIAGGKGFPQQEADEEWMANAIRIDYDAPFLADDDSIMSD